MVLGWKMKGFCGSVGVVHGAAVAEDGLVTTFDRIGTTFAIVVAGSRLSHLKMLQGAEPGDGQVPTSSSVWG